MLKLNDTQRVLLSAASQREDHSLLPVPDSVRAGARASKAIAALILAGLAIEAASRNAKAIYRQDGDLRFGAYATAAGLAAIGADKDGGGEGTCPAPAAKGTGKSAAIVALMQRPEGATIDELIAATGWLPHSTRAALTGLRKRGVDIDRGKRGSKSCYRIAGEAR